MTTRLFESPVMSDRWFLSTQPVTGLVGFGAFGRLIAAHLRAHCRIRVYDPALPRGTDIPMAGVEAGSLAQAASCPIVILAVPVTALEETVRAIRPYLVRHALVVDVGSVKVVPARIMCQELPDHVRIVATHPLFGPQSARDGIAGHRIAVCPLRGTRAGRLVAFLRRTLGLRVILTTPDAHDRDAATAQGLTHLLARVLVGMEPLPARITTRSFEHLRAAAGMVRHDAPEVYHAIAHLNPYSSAVRDRFFAIARQVEDECAAAGPAP
ncbi:prephenate dehydrogenase [Gluconacetobacter diazotrophicus]|nr:prephenate dehydrogenase [Gluconacetobacter diazotrophicus]